MAFCASASATFLGSAIAHGHVPALKKPLLTSFRDAKVLATNSTASWLLRRFLSKWGYELAGAGGNLIGLSNSLNLPDRHLHIDRIEKGLRLPSTHIPEFLDMVRNKIQQGS